MLEKTSTDTIVRTSYGTFALHSENDAKMAQQISSDFYPHKQLLVLARAYVSGGVVVDVGAHIGTVAVPLARVARHVIAFEPNPTSFAFLLRNAELNTVSVDARKKGLSDVPGRASVVATNARNAGAHTLSEGNDVEISTLDAEVERADFIKIDVEGMELSVLRGGEKLIVRSHPALFFEVNLTQLRNHGMRVSDVAAWLNEHGYILYVPITHQGKQALGRIRNLASITALITPRAWIFGGNCAVFDVLALSRQTLPRFPVYSFARTIGYLMREHLIQKYKRVVSFHS